MFSVEGEPGASCHTPHPFVHVTNAVVCKQRSELSISVCYHPATHAHTGAQTLLSSCRRGKSVQWFNEDTDDAARWAPRMR